MGVSSRCQNSASFVRTTSPHLRAVSFRPSFGVFSRYKSRRCWFFSSISEFCLKRRSATQRQIEWPQEYICVSQCGQLCSSLGRGVVCCHASCRRAVVTAEGAEMHLKREMSKGQTKVWLMRNSGVFKSRSAGALPNLSD